MLVIRLKGFFSRYAKWDDKYNGYILNVMDFLSSLYNDDTYADIKELQVHINKGKIHEILVIDVSFPSKVILQSGGSKVTYSFYSEDMDGIELIFNSDVIWLEEEDEGKIELEIRDTEKITQISIYANIQGSNFETEEKFIFSETLALQKSYTL